VSLAPLLAAQEERLSHCVHCGFCLPACPTYVRLGDENDSPRGRLHLMRAAVEGRLEFSDPAFLTHIDRCLGCRGCESVCPSGVEYGLLLERARAEIVAVRGTGRLTGLSLRIFPSGAPLDFGLALTRLLRATGIPDLLARLLPAKGLLGTARFGMAMVAGSRPGQVPAAPAGGADYRAAGDLPASGSRGRVGLLVGCVQRGLFARVNEATRRVLEVNGFEVVEVRDQGCCGALHAHAGELDGARDLARVNLSAFSSPELDYVVVNAAGCGAAMRDYHHLLEDAEPGRDPDADPGRSQVEAFVSWVRDVSEILAAVGPVSGAPIPMAVALDSPCHLLHAQRVTDAPQRMLAAIPELEVRLLPNADECCGGAGLYGVTHPELGGRIGSDKVKEVLESGALGAATGNPGCMMQIGAGLRMVGSDLQVWHPVELLDESYRRAGLYQGR